MKALTPVILAGGSGKRLWPLSRKSLPKQLANLDGPNSLFQQCALRLSSSEEVKFTKPLVITNSDFRFIIDQQLQDLCIEYGSIIVEPESKNTAAAILASALYSYQKDEETILFVAPSDHVISNTKAFHNAILCGLRDAINGKIVTFGIQPTRPDSGYGYLALGETTEHGTLKVEKFLEKPDKATAKIMLESGNHLWNSGMFMFRAINIIQAFQDIAPNFITPIEKSIVGGQVNSNFFQLDPEAWSAAEDCSIDHKIMEHIENIVAVPFFGGWSDLGGWDSVWQHMIPDEHGVVVSKNAHAIDCVDTLLRSESSEQEIIGLGLDNIIAISMPDAVLVANKNKAQEVKNVVSKLKLNNVRQAEQFPKEYRPWGWFELLTTHDRFQVKRIVVNPRACLSLQSHQYRSEHWVVVHGTGKVTVDEEVKLVSEGQSVHIPLAAIHRLENPGKVPLIVIETQIGVYLGEDDIIRYEDIYSRI